MLRLDVSSLEENPGDKKHSELIGQPWVTGALVNGVAK